MYQDSILGILYHLARTIAVSDFCVPLQLVYRARPTLSCSPEVRGGVAGSWGRDYGKATEGWSSLIDNITTTQFAQTVFVTKVSLSTFTLDALIGTAAEFTEECSSW